MFEVTPTDNRYQQALDFIYSFIDHERQPGPRSRAAYDLRRMDELLARVGKPHLKARTVHVAGTKGKGSVAAMVASALAASGFTTGLLTSPHLHHVNERFRVDGRPVPDGELAELVEWLRPEIEAVNRAATYGRLTTFEILTALGFCHFAGRGAEFQVIEVGLGGRLDATNVVRPDVCAITSISLDHTEVLGDTLAEIAAEKAGIVKPGVPVVSAPQAPEVQPVIAAACRRRGAGLHRVGEDIVWSDHRLGTEQQSIHVRGRRGGYDISIPLLGRHQLDNAAVAVGVLETLAEGTPEITPDTMQKGMAGVQWEGRLQVLSRSPLVVVDGAHNAESARRLRESLEEYFQYERAVLIIGMSSDKSLAGVVAELRPAFEEVIITRSIHPRAMATGLIAEEFARQGLTARETDDISVALPLALADAGERDLICVTGSLFVVAGAIEQAIDLSRTASA